MRKAAVAGLAGTAAATIAAAILHTVWRAVPFPPVAIAQILVRAPSGGFDSFFIERLGHWAQRLAVLGTSLAFAGSGAALGTAIPRLRARLGDSSHAAGAVALLPLWVISFALYPVTPQSLSRIPFAIVTLPVWLSAGAYAGRVFNRLSSQPVPGAASYPRDRLDDRGVTRRVAVKAIGFGGVGVLVGLANLGDLFFRGPDPGRQLFRGALTKARRPSPAPGDAEFANVAGLTKEVTSTAAHYVVDEEIIDPDIDPETWRLSVTGLVDEPLSLSYDDLRAYPAVERYQTLECISNKIGGHLVSTAKWIGVPAHLILADAGVTPDAVEVVFRASGGYSDSHALDVALDPTTLIAIGMNGHVLPRAHGFPARLLTVGTYGMKNPKWLTEIEVVDRPYQGFWEQRGWTKTAIVKTGARIDIPTSAGPGDEATIGGYAFAGARGISKVEVSVDGGDTWMPAQLKTPLSDYTWTLWVYRGVLGPGPIVARAYDGTGKPQTPQVMDPFPTGSSGYDSVSL
jgi:hypothetical protein